MFVEIILLFVVCFVLILLYVTSSNKKSLISLNGLHVVVTGGSAGIGYDLSVEAFERGANVSIIARNKVKITRNNYTLSPLKK